MPKVSSLDKSLLLLEAVLGSAGGIGTRGLTKLLGYNVATVHNIAMTFCARGYLRQDPLTKRFHPGARLAVLGHQPEGLQHLGELAAPIVESVARDLNESVLLGKIDGNRILNLKYVPSRQALRAQEPEDVSEHSYCTAFGKVLLASLPSGALDNYIRETPLRALTPFTLATPEALLPELDRVRERGYARTKDEYCEGVSAVAVPIRNPWGETIASIGASAPTLRMEKNEQFDLTLKTLREAAASIEEAWNGKPRRSRKTK